jgi:hypothetical protein
VTPPPQWYAPLPSGYARATKVGIMRGEFGTLGVALPVVLMAEAEAQKQLGGHRGVVKIAYADLAYLLAADAGDVRKAAERWAELGEMVDVEFRAHDFEARWKDWDNWQEPPSSPELDRAVEFLRSTLSVGARPTSEVDRLAHDAGIADTTLKRARRELRVVASKVGPQWELSLP